MKCIRSNCLRYFQLILILLVTSCGESEECHIDQHLAGGNTYEYVLGINIADCVTCHQVLYQFIKAVPENKLEENVLFIFDGVRSVEINAFIQKLNLKSDQKRIISNKKIIHQYVDDLDLNFFTTFIAVYDGNKELIYINVLKNINDISEIPGL